MITHLPCAPTDEVMCNDKCDDNAITQTSTYVAVRDEPYSPALSHPSSRVDFGDVFSLIIQDGK